MILLFAIGLGILIHCGVAEIMFIAERLPLQGDRSLTDTPWPLPLNWTRTNETLTLNPLTLTFETNLPQCDVISDTLRRYTNLIQLYKERTPAKTHDVTKVSVQIKNDTCEELPHLGMDESYSLVTSSEGISIASHSIWGALRGLETFSQLLLEKDGQIMVKKWVISDRPRFPHRGFMIDTSRHYLPMPIIKKHLDAMTWSKMNVLHWHIVDSQSFPYVSTEFPQLSEKGAFSPRHVYTQRDVADIIEYARLRGIRVVPEFDSPGHAHSWGKGIPGLLTPCWVDGEAERAKYGQYNTHENFDPSRNSTFEFLEKFVPEIARVFQDQYLHAGFDEAHYMCWQSSPNITQFMMKQGFGNDSNAYPRLEQYYVTKALEIIAGTGKNVIMWQDPLDNGANVSSSVLIEVWKGKSATSCNDNSPPWEDYAAKIAKGGNRMLISSCYYLNYISYGEDWRKYYLCDPQAFNGTDEEKARVLGGEACMWAEFVDGTNFLQRSWPRAAAVAERLWSPDHVTDVNTAAFRLDAHRCRLLRRGIPAQPVLPGYCGDYDYGFEITTEEVTIAPELCATGSAFVKVADRRITFLLNAFLILFLY